MYVWFVEFNGIYINSPCSIIFCDLSLCVWVHVREQMACTDTPGDSSLKSSSKTECRHGFTVILSCSAGFRSQSCIDEALTTGWHGRAGRGQPQSCPGVTFPGGVPCELCPPVRTADGENRKKRNEQLKPLVSILSERSCSHAFYSGEVFDDQGELEVQLCSRRHLERAFHGCWGETQRSPSLPGDSHHFFQDWNSVFWLWDFWPFLLDVKT